MRPQTPPCDGVQVYSDTRNIEKLETHSKIAHAVGVSPFRMLPVPSTNWPDKKIACGIDLVAPGALFTYLRDFWRGGGARQGVQTPSDTHISGTILLPVA